MSKRLDKGNRYGTSAASIRMRCARLLVQASLSLWGRPIPLYQLGTGAYLEREALQVLSRHRTGARVALQQRPVFLRDRSIVYKRRGGNQSSSSIGAAISIGAASSFDHQQAKDV